MFIQQTSTSYRLPPTLDLGGNGGHGSYLTSHARSHDGKFLGVVYDRPYDPPMANSQLTVIWQIEEKFNFERRMQNGPWGRKVSSHVSMTGLFLRSPNSILFGTDDHCSTPSGKVRLPLGRRIILLDSIFATREFRSIYRCSGECIIISDGKERVWRFAAFGVSVPTQFACYDIKGEMMDASSIGRYLSQFNF